MDAVDEIFETEFFCLEFLQFFKLQNKVDAVDALFQTLLFLICVFSETSKQSGCSGCNIFKRFLPPFLVISLKQSVCTGHTLKI